MTITVNLLVIMFTSGIIYYFGNIFADASSNLGDYFYLPKSVKGATFDAIAGSMPELMVALFSVLIFKKFELGIGTIAGSALFNLLIIPAVCVLVAPSTFKVSKEIINRDGLFYNFSVFALLAALMYSKTWGLLIPIIFLGLYGIYLKIIIKDSRVHKENIKENKKLEKSKNNNEISLSKELGIGFGTMIVIGFATYFLAEHSIELAYSLGVAPIIVGFTIAAAATSIPDTVISIANAKKGNIDDAASNVFGSNIFDILVGLSIPLLIVIWISGPVEIVFDQIEIILGLLCATIVVLFFLAEDRTLNVKQSWYMLGIYLMFIVYVVYLSIISIV